MMDTNQQPKPPGSAGTQGVSSLKKTAADATTTARSMPSARATSFAHR